MNRQGQCMGVLALMTAGLALMVLCPVKFSIGGLHIEKVLALDKDEYFPQGFGHTVWDGPTGDMTSGDVCTFKLGSLMWRLDVWSGPL